jgi:hypothetical protein
MPTTPARARRWLEEGKAVVVQNALELFQVQLTREPSGRAVSEVVVVGSQAVLGQFPDAPRELRVSAEADIYSEARPDASEELLAIGAGSRFHDQFGFFVDGVDPATALLPEGWRERAIRVQNENTRGFVGVCPEIHDLAISKLARGEDKDTDYVGALLYHRLARLRRLAALLQELQIDEGLRSGMEVALKIAARKAAQRRTR